MDRGFINPNEKTKGSLILRIPRGLLGSSSDPSDTPGRNPPCVEPPARPQARAPQGLLWAALCSQAQLDQWLLREVLRERQGCSRCLAWTNAALRQAGMLSVPGTGKRRAAPPLQPASLLRSEQG